MAKCPKCAGTSFDSTLIVTPGGRAYLIHCQSCQTVVGATPDLSDVMNELHRIKASTRG
jgi:uncharacterized Zn finger protein